MASVVANGGAEEYGEAEPKKPVKRGFAKIDVVDVILSGDGDGPAKTPPSAFEQLAESTISKVKKKKLINLIYIFFFFET